MAIMRVNKSKNYTTISNYHLKEKNMSLKAKGLLTLMLSLPEDWDYSVSGLVAICKENETAITSALKELQSFGYLKMTKLMPNKAENRSKIEYVYDVFEHPQENINQVVENLPIEKQVVEKQGQLNTNNKITNKLNTNNFFKEKERKRTYEEILEEDVPDNELRDLYEEFIKMRQLMKLPLTEKGLELLIQRVNKLAPDSIEHQRELLDMAIMNSWKTVYEIRGNNLKKQNSFNIDLYESTNIFDNLINDDSGDV